MESGSLKLLYSCFLWSTTYAKRSSVESRLDLLMTIDYGSDVLSDETYLQSVREILGTPTPDERLQDETVGCGRDSDHEDERRIRRVRRAKAQAWKAMEDHLRGELSADNREKLMQLSRDFAPLALGLRKIWTFVEVYGTDLKVLSGGGKEGEELEVVELNVSKWHEYICHRGIGIRS